jgi:CspA family cold shock protein
VGKGRHDQACSDIILSEYLISITNPASFLPVTYRLYDPAFCFWRPDILKTLVAPSRRMSRADQERRRGMATGTVKWFNSTKGFGFIAPDGGGNDVFVHISAVERAGLTGLADNQKVSFDLEQGRDGRAAASNLKAL